MHLLPHIIGNDLGHLILYVVITLLKVDVVSVYQNIWLLKLQYGLRPLCQLHQSCCEVGKLVHVAL